MADASSASPPKTAAQLREAAKQTMRRKQAPALRPPIPPTRNSPNVSSSNHSSSTAPLSATPFPVKVPPKGPRGVPYLSATNTVPLNYGDPNDSSTTDAPAFPGGAGPSGASGTSEPRRMSATRARLAAGKGEDGPEEGEISDEEARAKRRESARPRPYDKSTFATPPTPQPPLIPGENADSSLMDLNASDGISKSGSASRPTEAANDGDGRAKGAVRESIQTWNPMTESALMTATTSRRSNSSGGMQPPPPPTNVHREPAPISPTASAHPTQIQAIGKTLADIGKRGDEPVHDLPRHQFHSVSSAEARPLWTLPTSLMTNGPAKYAHGDGMSYLRPQPEEEEEEEEEEETSELSPRTEHMNQEVFSHLMQLGVDDDHCRPGLPMTFQQFKAAKELILDLLGYGMTPEHIADIGLNRRLLVYCLRELKIRLPANVPVDDIIMFDPPFKGTSERSKEDSEASSAPSPGNDDLRSPTSMEITPVDGLIVEAVSETSSARSSSPPVALEPYGSKSPSPPPRHPLPPMPKLNVHAEPFLPAKPPPQTTGPSLFAIALPHQQIPPMPARDQLAILPILPPSLPRRPVLSYDAASSRRSTAGSSSAATVVAVSTFTEIDTEMEPPSHDSDMLQRLEQEKKLLLLLQLRKKGGLTLSTSDRPGSTPPQAPVAKVATDAEPQHKTSILGGERVGSPSPMDIDTPISQTPAAPNVQPPVTIPPPNSIVMPKRPPVLRSRGLTSTESTRPSTPSEAGPKRGVKRPKADDFVEDNQPAKKSARLNGAMNIPPLKRSSFAIANSAPQEQLIITWIDDENVEIPNLSSWNQQRDFSSVNSARDHEAAQLAAAAMAIGLPMTAEELETARIQEEERKAQLNAKAAKLLQIQANLKRLELKKAEKKLQTLQNAEDQSAASKQILAVQSMVITLKQELEAIKTKLFPPQSMAVAKIGVKDTSPAENTPRSSTPDTPLPQLEPPPPQEQAPNASVLELSTYPTEPSSSSVAENEDWDMLKDDDSDIVILDGPPVATDRASAGHSS